MRQSQKRKEKNCIRFASNIGAGTGRDRVKTFAGIIAGLQFFIYYIFGPKWERDMYVNIRVPLIYLLRLSFRRVSSRLRILILSLREARDATIFAELQILNGELREKSRVYRKRCIRDTPLRGVIKMRLAVKRIFTLSFAETVR